MSFALNWSTLPFTKTCDTRSEVTEKLMIIIFLSIKVWYGLKATVYDQCFCERSKKIGSDKGEYLSTSVMTIRVFSSPLRVERSEQKWSSLAKKYFSSDQEILLGEIKNSLRSKIKLKLTQKTNL